LGGGDQIRPASIEQAIIPEGVRGGGIRWEKEENFTGAQNTLESLKRKAILLKSEKGVLLRSSLIIGYRGVPYQDDLRTV